MAKRPLALRIDEDLLTRVDRARGDVSRTRFVERALESALGGVPAERPGVAAESSREDAPVARPPAPSRAPRKPSLADTWRR